MIKHTQGKTASASAPKVVVVNRCESSVVCPVTSMETYVEGSRKMGVDLRAGFLFRRVDGRGRVLEVPISYDVAYEKLKSYLCALGIYEGETPHSLRGGCAVTMRLTGAAKGVEDLKQHVGWRSSRMPLQYSRAQKAQDMGISQRLSRAISGHGEVTARQVETMHMGESYDLLPGAFQ